MKKDNTIWLLLLALCGIIAGCKKEKTEITTTDQLPPATQTGANTFGCLINGKVWVPKGFDGNFTNSRINIDPTFSDGDLNIRVYKIYDAFNERMTLSSDSIKSPGIYYFKTNSRAKYVFSKLKRDLSSVYCDMDNGNIGGNPNHINGYIKITKYDLQNNIFSGEFEISFNSPNCGLGDPVNITQGRFDYKL